MKTTVDIPENLLKQARQKAARENTTLKAILHAALRCYLASENAPRKKFKLKDGSVGGKGIRPGLDESDWSKIRQLAYEGRGA